MTRTIRRPVTARISGTEGSGAENNLDLSRLLLWPDTIVYVGNGFSGGSAIKYSATLLVSLEDQPLRISSPDLRDLETRICVVPPKVVRAIEVTGKFASINFDPGSWAYTAITRSFSPGAITNLEDHTPGDWDPGVCAFLWDATDCSAIRTDLHGVVDELCPADTPRENWIDERVRMVLDKIRKDVPTRPDVGRHARELGISRDRLTHLFSQELGIPLRSFVLWCKARRAVEIFSRDPGMRIDEIASEAGFSDVSHGIRTLNRFIGVNPKFIRGLESLDILHCSSADCGA